MTKEDNADNKAQEETPKTDNKVEAKEPNFPDIDKGQDDKGKEEVKPQDPEMQKWLDETKTLENAYSRVKGSREEVEKYQQEIEAAKKEKEEFQQQVAQEIQAIYQKDPDTASKLFGVDAQGNPLNQDDQKGQTAGSEGEQQIDPNTIAEQAARQAQAKLEVDNFYENNSQYVKDEDDWAAIQKLALKFVDEKDADGKPYTIKTALKDALLIRHKELIGDDAVMKHLSNQAKRVSATEHGDAGGSSAGEMEITDEEIAMAKEMGVDIEKYKKRKQRQLQS